MKHKQDAIDNSTRLIDLHKGNGLSFGDATKAALVTAEESTTRDRSLTQRTVNHLREIVYGPETAKLIHDTEAALQRAYGHRGFEFVAPENEDDMGDEEIETEYDLQKEAYNNKIADLKKELSQLKERILI